jgi:hypothetical protein
MYVNILYSYSVFSVNKHIVFYKIEEVLLHVIKRNSSK